jgi:cyclophilin family peptidyl-prolyl cis-trans isomerase
LRIIGWMQQLRLMTSSLLSLFLLAVLTVLTPAVVRAQGSGDGPARTIVRFDTVEGPFDVELYDDLMPRTVANFLVYVNGGRYDGSVVHRNSDTTIPSIRDFVIQGGGFFLQDPVPPGTTITQSSVILEPPILDEPGGGVPGPSNVRGTIAMAKSGPDTVTSQWFFNQADNSFLDDPTRDGGFSAFGEVLGDGMTVVDAIGDLPLPTDFGFGIDPPFNDLPLRNFNGNSIEDVRVANTVTVNSISVVPEPSAAVLAAASLAMLALVRVGRPAATPRTASACVDSIQVGNDVGGFE